MSKESNTVSSGNTPVTTQGNFNSSLYESFVRTFGTGIAVASALYPLEVYLTRLQTGGCNQSSVMRSSPVLLSWKALLPLIRGYSSTVQASVMKNSVIANRSTISRNVEESVSTEKLNASAKYTTLALTTGVIAGLDTAFTNYQSNTRVLTSNGIVPTFNNVFDRFRFGSQGLSLRYLRNFFGAMGCIGADTVLSDLVKPYVSDEEHPILNKVVTSLFAGLLVTPFTNAFDIISKRKVSSVDFGNMSSKSYLELISELFKAEGAMGFTRGLGVNSVRTVLAFFLVNTINDYISQHVFSDDNQAGFFAEQDNSSEPKVEIAAVEESPEAPNTSESNSPRSKV